MGGLIFRISRFLIDLLFPVTCLNCHKTGEWLCDNCLKQIKFKTSQYCFNCKRSNIDGSFCLPCQAKSQLNGIVIAADYEDEIIKKLIKTCKYGFVKDIGQILGKILNIFLISYLQQNNKIRLDNLSNYLIVPVPLANYRRRWRGFNQAEIIAGELTKANNLKLTKQNLIRIKNTKAQAGLDEATRQRNLLDCFKWTGDNLIGQNIILIDDVATTGSTLNECAKALKIAGANQVLGLVVAKG